jgi:hypothetical protein
MAQPREISITFDVIGRSCNVQSGFILYLKKLRHVSAEDSRARVGCIACCR